MFIKLLFKIEIFQILDQRFYNILIDKFCCCFRYDFDAMFFEQDLNLSSITVGRTEYCYIIDICTEFYESLYLYKRGLEDIIGFKHLNIPAFCALFNTLVFVSFYLLTKDAVNKIYDLFLRTVIDDQRRDFDIIIDAYKIKKCAHTSAESINGLFHIAYKKETTVFMQSVP